MPADFKELTDIVHEIRTEIRSASDRSSALDKELHKQLDELHHRLTEVEDRLSNYN